MNIPIQILIKLMFYIREKFTTLRDLIHKLMKYDNFVSEHCNKKIIIEFFLNIITCCKAK